MDEVIANILVSCQAIIPETYYMTNDNPSITYPYAIFTYDGDARTWNQDGFYIDVDIFDNLGQNQERIEEKTSQLKQHLEHKSELLGSCLVRYRYNGSSTISTNSDTLQRRNLRFYLTVDWSKDYG